MLRKLSTYLSLGITNISRVFIYRALIRLGLHPVLRISARIPSGPFFKKSLPAPEGAIARTTWSEEGIWFGSHKFPTLSPPNWHYNPFSDSVAESNIPWFKIKDFDSQLGDIKGVWEASRFDWLIAMAQRAALGDHLEIARLNHWIEDWIIHNPPYYGSNWKCGQESSIRVMHIVLAAMIVGQIDNPCTGLRDLLKVHLKRIAPTVGYAIGQQNNHGTSEATALFIGGLWLSYLGENIGNDWEITGRKLLEDRANLLISDDGSFSQYSTVYHRLMIDSYSLAETFRKKLSAEEFSPSLLSKLKAATYWLQHMVDTKSGDSPNFGANDGARILALADTDYRDFRPSLQWAANSFLNADAVSEEGPWDQHKHWLGLPLKKSSIPRPQSITLNDGGLHILRSANNTAYLRYPRFSFRPSHSDILHLDLWVNNENIFRDGGTYSYNSTQSDLEYFSGVESHNTVQFDGRDQMPRISRFLFGLWPRSKEIKFLSSDTSELSASASYIDFMGSSHSRKINLSEEFLVCEDKLSGQAETAILRWRLKPGNWKNEGDSFYNGDFQISIKSNCDEMKISMVDGYESRYYLNKSVIDVIEVYVKVPAYICTTVYFPDKC